MKRSDREPDAALAAVEGGAVTRERLLRAASEGGRSASPFVHSILAQPLPGRDDLARAYAAGGGTLRADGSFVRIAPAAARALDPELLRAHRCVPVELLEGVCLLAVSRGHERAAAVAIRAALRRDVLPVLADPGAIDAALARLDPAPLATRHGPLPRRDSAVHARFRDLALSRMVLDPLPWEPGP